MKHGFLVCCSAIRTILLGISSYLAALFCSRYDNASFNYFVVKLQFPIFAENICFKIRSKFSLVGLSSRQVRVLHLQNILLKICFPSILTQVGVSVCRLLGTPESSLIIDQVFFRLSWCLCHLFA